MIIDHNFVVLICMFSKGLTREASCGGLRQPEYFQHHFSLGCLQTCTPNLQLQVYLASLHPKRTRRNGYNSRGGGSGADTICNGAGAGRKKAGFRDTLMSSVHTRAGDDLLFAAVRGERALRRFVLHHNVLSGTIVRYVTQQPDEGGRRENGIGGRSPSVFPKITVE